MPEASMDKDDDPAGWQNNIRRSRQIPSMQPEAISSLEQQLAHKEFGLRILGTNAGHHCAALLTGDYVHGVNQA